MGRRTIDIGIDLGTTNSAIACMEKGESRVLKNYLRSEYTPSVVRIDEKGTIIVGRKAYERLLDDPDNSVGEFKRWMGSQQTHKFKLSKKTFNAEELSAEVLKDLKVTAKASSAQEEEINCAVITVPCNFEIVQCEATQRAADLAGIKFAPLLQEPIAASVAYGFIEKMPKGYWVVFDLGGGTFDVAVMSAKEGRLSVVDHCGDNYLGGKDFDWKIVKTVVYPELKKEYNLPKLGRTEEYHLLNAVLKSAAEEAKIELSVRKEANIIIHPRDILKDKDGKMIDIAIPLKQSKLISLIEEYVDKTVELFGKVLKNQKLSSGDINQLILVGGPTQTPYIRKRLKDEFGIPADYKIDPITVVAQGAAIFASSKLMPDELTKRDHSKVFIKLAYNPMTTETEVSVGGRLLPSKEKDKLPDGMRIQISSLSGDWESGMIELKDNAFFTNVSVREQKVNSFNLTLFDNLGNKIPIDPDSFDITQGISVAEPPLIRSIGVELEDGSFSKHLNKNEALPARSKPSTYYTTRTVQPGEDEAVLNIHVLEGESEIANRNRHLGTLKIKGDEIKKTIPENSEIEIIINVDQSRSVSAEAFCPLLDQKFSKILEQIKLSPKIEPEHIAQDLDGEQKRIEMIEKGIQATQDKEVKQKLTEAKVEDEINEIKGDIEAAKGGDPDAVEKADRRLKELKQDIDSLENLSHWPIVLGDYNSAMEGCKETIDSYGEDEEKQQLDSLKKDAEKAINNRDIKLLNKVIEAITSMRWVILFRQPGYWIACFQEIKKNPVGFINDSRAQELITEGSMALQRQDLDSLKSIMMELWSLMPAVEQEKIGGIVSDAGIRK
ncbi:Hsp70 family protein [Candidatus Omnitrophota bacterium]